MSSVISCGFSIPGTLFCNSRFSSCAARNATSLSSRYKSDISSPVNSYYTNFVLVNKNTITTTEMLSSNYVQRDIVTTQIII